MHFFDSHCHLHDNRIIDRAAVIEKRSVQAGVLHMVSCATMESNFETTVHLARQYPSIIPCLGIHPWFIGSRTRRWQSVLISAIQQNRAGIGETGLDFVDKSVDREDQIAVFEKHLAVAREMHRPVNVHVRNAWDAFIHLIKRMGPLPAGGLIHSYSGSADMIPIFEKYNWHVSFSGAATRPGAKKVVKALQAVSPDRILLETDSPDILPSLPGLVSGELNEPANLPGIAAVVAAKKGIFIDVLAKCTFENSMELFRELAAGRRV